VEASDQSLSFQPFDELLEVMSMDPAERYLAVSSEQGAVKVFELEKLFSGEHDPLMQLKDHEQGVNQIVFRDLVDEVQMVSIGVDGKINIYSMNAQRLLYSYKFDKKSLAKIYVHEDSDKVFVHTVEAKESKGAKDSPPSPTQGLSKLYKLGKASEPCSPLGGGPALYQIDMLAIKAVETFHQLKTDEEKARQAELINLSLCFSRSNLATAMAYKGDAASTRFALDNNKEMLILDQGGVLQSPGLMKVITADNSIMERIQIEEEDKLEALFRLYKDNNISHKFMHTLNLDYIKKFYDKYKTNMDQEIQSIIVN